MIYGSAIGDAIGLSTRGMTPDHAAFHYDGENIQYTDIVLDEHRVRWRTGDWSSNFDLCVSYILNPFNTEELKWTLPFTVLD